MNNYARWLFGIAAIFNFSVSVALLLLRPWLSPLIYLDPAHGTNLVLTNFTGSIIALFGYGYVRVAFDPTGYRIYIPFSVIGKSLAVWSVISVWATGAISGILPALIGGDAIFALLFLDFLRRTRAPRV